MTTLQKNSYHADSPDCEPTICRRLSLNQLGVDHTKLTFRHAGRDFRLTDVSGHVIKAIQA